MGDHKLDDEALDTVSGGIQNINMSGSNIGGDQVLIDNSINAGGGVTQNTTEGDIIGQKNEFA